MNEINIKLPAMGEGITDAIITRWLVTEGDKVEADQPVVEIATDKVDSEILSPDKGKISIILKKENEVAQVGETIAVLINISEKSEADDTVNNSLNNISQVTDEQNDVSVDSTVHTVTVHKHRFIPPFVRSLANDFNITPDELTHIKGSGKDGILTKEDIKNYILKRQNEKIKNIRSDIEFKPVIKENKPIIIDQEYIENSEIIEMDRMRKLIADHMVRSKSISPHVTSFIEADVTNLVTWRNNIKEKFKDQVGEKLTYTPIFIEAVVKALKKYSMVNASVDNNNIYIKKNINIGIATALTNGNLIVPVIKDADKKNLTGLAREVNDIVKRARQNKLTPGETKGGTFTITNLGNYESMAGTPIINQPEVAILAIGAIIRKPAVVMVNGSETIGIRDIVVLSLAYDHRIIDGSLGGMFLKYIRDILRDFDANRSV